MPPHQKPKVCKDPEWLKVVRGMPCWCWPRHREHIAGGFTACRPEDTIGRRPSEASHLDGKSRDDRVLPMCGGCHRTSHHSWHSGQTTFGIHFGATKAQLIREAEALYREWKAR